jgi:glutamate/tyrosine decarboxylase-like PLP-dependent enzyme
MTTHSDPYDAPLARADAHARAWLASLPLPDGPTDPADVIDLLAAGAEPGLVGMPSGRFFGFVIGGTHPAALAADWLVSAWDQNCSLRLVTPAHTAVEDTAGAWLLDWSTHEADVKASMAALRRAVG